MVWKEGKDHIIDYYFRTINLKGIISKNKHHVQYSDVPSAIRQIFHGPDLPVHEPDGCNDTALAPTRIHPLLIIHFSAGDQLVVQGG